MTDKPENPPAFPVAWPVPNAPEPGMTLRDYFAAAALQGECAAQDDVAFGIATTNAHFENAACRAYKFADAMLKARQS